MSDLRQSIPAAAVQDLFDCARNAGDKGVAQYCTPDRFGEFCAALLTGARHTIADLTAGHGALLRAARQRQSRLFAIELDPLAAGAITVTEGSRSAHVLQGDFTAIAPVLHAADFCADVWTLNPPWDLHLYRERLAFLAESPVTAVREAFDRHDGRTSRDTIDSTVATWMTALTLAQPIYGEGFLIANESTLQRLVLGPDAPHGALAAHAWAHAVFPGSVFASPAGSGKREADSAEPFPPSPSPLPPAASAGISCDVGVLWWAVGHRHGPAELTDRLRPLWDAAATATEFKPDPAVFNDLRLLRGGSEPRQYHTHADRQLADWAVAAEEWSELRRVEAGGQRPFHLGLAPDGTIYTRLNRFEGRTIEASKAQRLHALTGRTPLQLVIQRADRNLLLAVARDEGWRVDPLLLAAIETALAEYHRVRAPLVPLNDVQRTGYLDEEDTIRCRSDLTVELKPDAKGKGGGTVIFRAGQRYAIRTVTAGVTRKAQKFNFAGELEDVSLSGKHLALFLTGEPPATPQSAIRNPQSAAPVEACFMDRSLLAEGHEFENGARVDATLHDLAAHFEIPDVPDLATVRPADYRQNLAFLTTLETLLSA